jgi:hypothetical protein
MITIGTTLTYKAFDEEYYSRGYGVQFETKQRTVDEIRYKVSSHYQDIGVNNIVSENKNPSVGDTVNFQFWDGEEGRSYGWHLTKKEGTISELFYRMKNGDLVNTNVIKEVKG